MERSEKILVCLSGAPSNARVIRAAAKMAKAYKGSLTALFVQPPNFEEHTGEARARLDENIRLARSLGAQTARLYGEDAATQIAEYARVSGTTKIVLGKSPVSRKPFSGSSLIDRLNELAPDIDIFIIPDTNSSSVKAPKQSFSDEHFSFADVIKTISILILCTLIGFLFTRLGFSTANVIIIYIIGVLGIAMLTAGRSYSLSAAVLSVLIFNFFFTQPYFSLFADPSHIATFIIMFVAALFISSLTTRIKRQTRLTAQRAYRTEILLETSQKLQKAESEEQILSLTATQLVRLSARSVMVYPEREGKLGSPMLFPYEMEELSDFLSDSERKAAEWVLKNNRQAGKSTRVFGEAKGLYMAIHGADSVLGVVCFAMADSEKLESYEKTLAVAILDECGIILENERNLRAKREMEEKARAQELRANLLRSISHDLRTPLTGISGSASLLLEKELDSEKSRRLLSSIRDDSEWLIELVENLLSITRIEGGEKLTQLRPELIGEVFYEALSHIDRASAKHIIKTELCDEYLMAYMDAKLIMQVIINIVNNAVKYTPEGSTIVISAEAVGDKAEIKIADDGEGIPDSSKARIFDMFYTEGNVRGDGRRGLGLGLALCKSIVAAHGGSISVSDNSPKGAVFTFGLDRVTDNE